VHFDPASPTQEEGVASTLADRGNMAWLHGLMSGCQGASSPGRIMVAAETVLLIKCRPPCRTRSGSHINSKAERRYRVEFTWHVNKVEKRGTCVMQLQRVV
jgi:hypothetical protein